MTRQHPRVGRRIIAVKRLAPIVEFFGIYAQVVAFKIVGVFFEYFRQVERFARGFVYPVPEMIENTYLISVFDVAFCRYSAQIVYRRQVSRSIVEIVHNALVVGLRSRFRFGFTLTTR